MTRKASKTNDQRKQGDWLEYYYAKVRGDAIYCTVDRLCGGGETQDVKQVDTYLELTDVNAKHNISVFLCQSLLKIFTQMHHLFAIRKYNM